MVSKARIVVVEDEPAIRRGVSDALRITGYDVAEAADGHSGLIAATQPHVDLILLDISFPPDVANGGGVPWDGFLIMSWLRRLEEAKNIPIIVITGGEPEKYKERALAAGAVSFFHKPIEHEELLAVIHQTLGDRITAAPISA